MATHGDVELCIVVLKPYLTFTFYFIFFYLRHKYALKKLFFRLSRFWPLKGGVGGLSDSVENGKFKMKIFFSYNVE